MLKTIVFRRILRLAWFAMGVQGRELQKQGWHCIPVVHFYIRGLGYRATVVYLHFALFLATHFPFETFLRLFMNVLYCIVRHQ